MSSKPEKKPVPNGASPGPCTGLSPEDQRHLGELEKKFQLVRDRTAGVAQNYNTGLFLYGGGGVGKSYTALEELKRLKAHFVVFNSRMTGRGLYNALERYPDAVHVLEDMEQIMRDRGAQGVLRSALWGQRRDGDRGPIERTVTWSTYRMPHSFVFSGGIIMTANQPLHDLPALDAVKTRIAVIHLQPTDPELRALMRSVALKGYEHEGRTMTPEECVDVCEFIIEQSMALHRSLDMRVLINSFQDFLQWSENDAGCHWRDLVATRLRERPTAFREEVSVESRASRKARELEIVRQILATTADRQERLRLWQEKTGKSEAAFYRRMAELKEK